MLTPTINVQGDVPELGPLNYTKAYTSFGFPGFIGGAVEHALTNLEIDAKLVISEVQSPTGEPQLMEKIDLSASGNPFIDLVSKMLPASLKEITLDQPIPAELAPIAQAILASPDSVTVTLKFVPTPAAAPSLPAAA